MAALRRDLDAQRGRGEADQRPGEGLFQALSGRFCR